MGLENISSDLNVKGLRRLFDTVRSEVRGLRALGITAESYVGLFVFTVNCQIASRNASNR